MVLLYSWELNDFYDYRFIWLYFLKIYLFESIRWLEKEKGRIKEIYESFLLKFWLRKEMSDRTSRFTANKAFQYYSTFCFPSISVYNQNCLEISHTLQHLFQNRTCSINNKCISFTIKREGGKKIHDHPPSNKLFARY